MPKTLVSLFVAFSFLAIPAFAQVSDVDPLGANACADLTVSLRYGMRDSGSSNDVTVLQDFLNSNNYLSSQPTGFFGRMTFNAVKAFQTANGISASGFVGPVTRAKIKAIDCNGSSQTTPPPTSPTLPVISLSLNGTPIVNGGTAPVAGGTATFVWGSTGATSCTYNGIDIGTSGTRTFTNQPAQTGTYKCINSSGASTIVFTIVPSNTSTSNPSAPTATISAFPTSVINGSGTTLTWSSTNTQYCERSTVTASTLGQYTSGQIATSGTSATNALIVNPTPFNLRCMGTNGQYAYASVSVNMTSTTAAPTNPCFVTGAGQTCAPNTPVLYLSVNGASVANGGTVRVAGGTATFVWASTGATSCTYNGVAIPTTGTQTFTNQPAQTGVFKCTNSAGAATLTFTIAAPTTTTTGSTGCFVNGPGGTCLTTTETAANLPSITLLINGSPVVHGGAAAVAGQTATFTWSSKGVSSCTYNGVDIGTSGTRTFTNQPGGFGRIECPNSVGGGTTVLAFAITNAAGDVASAPTASLTVNGVNVADGGVAPVAGITAAFRWFSQRATTCYYNGVDIGPAGSATFPNQPAQAGKLECANSFGSTVINFTITPAPTSMLVTSSSAVLGVSTQCIDLPYNMHRGYESYAVTRLQEFLKSKNFLSETSGFYGDETMAAVSDYQASKNLPVTGMVYDFTRAAIKDETCQ